MIHRLVSVLKAMEKRYKPLERCVREAFIQRTGVSILSIYTTGARCADRPGPQQLARRRRATDKASATLCKAACLNTQQTAKNVLNSPSRSAAVLLCDSFYGKAFSQTSV
ncbi:hypothetical protein [Paraburkholderia antibiotica]|uniref:Uncharacterized protein n=1 Tax=Paraburkholderia antibiotica TaxID=2728839 RepID=A0A7X9X8H5_9BURK|nr:hypothetical protein [Paraburkholderia antibiotica]NML33463.1 hypothetical protein [Paraburkholderia antibiotica]